MAYIQVFGMSPPIAIGWFSFRGIELSFFAARLDSNPFEILPAIVSALLVWIVGAGVLWTWARRRLSLERVDAHRSPAIVVRASLPCSPSQSATILPITTD
ncbi:MAG TPA: hypothetical protein VGP68_17595 [Gemmataceae bacterium]|nr:hypothetical protein [Gemmataceae bacterium]